MSKKSSDNQLPFLIGVDLGGTKILAAVVTSAGAILSRSKTRTRAEEGPGAVVRRIVKCVRNVMKSAKVSAEQVSVVGVGSPGPLNPETGVIETMPNLEGWEHFPLKTVLEQHLGMRVYVDNDVNVGTYGEYVMGAGVGRRDMMGIFIGTGIGGGLVLDGRMYYGFNRSAGEVGHMVIKTHGPRCNCGRKGCYEALAGRLSLVKRMESIARRKGIDSIVLRNRALGQRTRSGELADAYRGGDAAVVQALEEMAGYTGIVIANLMNLINLELYVLGGGVMEALGAELVPLVEEKAREEAFPNSSRNVRVRPAMLGDDSGIVGAAFLALERMKTAP